LVGWRSSERLQARWSPSIHCRLQDTVHQCQVGHTFFESETCSHFKSGSNPFLIGQSRSSRRDGHDWSIEHFPAVLAVWQQRFWQWQLEHHRVFACMEARTPSHVRKFTNVVGLSVSDHVHNVADWQFASEVFILDVISFNSKHVDPKHTAHCFVMECRQLIMQLISHGPAFTSTKCGVHRDCQEDGAFDPQILGRPPEFLQLACLQCCLLCLHFDVSFI